MARAADAGGVEQIVATPHVSASYRNDPASVPRLVAEVQAAIDAAGIALRVHAGAEVSHAMVQELPGESLRAATLGDGDYLLLEPPLSGPAPFLERMVEELQLEGFKILLAHPERIAAFHRDVRLLARLVEQGCLTSLTAGSVAGQFGGQVERFSHDLFARGLVHNLASDAHDAHHRSPALAPTLAQACEQVPGLDPWLAYLTVDVPAAILAGEPPPGEPPVLEPRRGFLSRLRGR